MGRGEGGGGGERNILDMVWRLRITEETGNEELEYHVFFPGGNVGRCGVGIIIYIIICLKSVVVRKLQVAILARSPREMNPTDRIV